MTVTARRPRQVYSVGSDPDPRFTLANERTYLAWIRTAMAIFALSVAISVLPVPGADSLHAAGALLCGALAIGMVCAASARWVKVERALRLEQPLPGLGWVMLIITIPLTAALVLSVLALADEL